MSLAPPPPKPKTAQQAPSAPAEGVAPTLSAPGPDTPAPASAPLLDKATLGVAMMFFVGFAALYHGIAEDLTTLSGYHRFNNVLFGADQLDAQDGWAEDHKGIHPLVLLVTVPCSKIAERITGSWDDGLLILAAMCGGACVGVFFLLCRLICDRTGLAAAITLFFGLSMSQLVYGSVPDTYVLAALSTLPSWILTVYCLHTRRVLPGWWIVAGVLSFGVTLTMFLHTLLGLTLVLLRVETSWRPRLIGAVHVALGVGVCAVGLCFLQRGLIPEARLFFSPGEYKHEVQYTSDLALTNPDDLALELGRNFLFTPFVGTMPESSRFVPGRRVELSYYRVPLRYGAVGLAAAGLWAGLLLAGLWGGPGSVLTRRFLVIVSVALGSNIVLHAFYNTTEIFMCSPHFAFLLVLAAVTPAWNDSRCFTALWLALAVLTGVNNLQLIDDTITRYSAEQPADFEEPLELISVGEVWRYHPGRTSPGAGWTTPEFDDSQWAAGPASFGYGHEDDQTVLDDMPGRYPTLFLRHHFELTTVPHSRHIWADVLFDDGFALYVNGERCASRFVPEHVEHLSLATGLHDAVVPYRYFIPPELLRPGRNTLAVVVLNRKLDSTDLKFDMRLCAPRADR